MDNYIIRYLFSQKKKKTATYFIESDYSKWI